MITNRIRQFALTALGEINISTGNVLIGRVGGPGPAQEITLGDGLEFDGTELRATAQEPTDENLYLTELPLDTRTEATGKRGLDCTGISGSAGYIYVWFRDSANPNYVQIGIELYGGESGETLASRIKYGWDNSGGYVYASSSQAGSASVTFEAFNPGYDPLFDAYIADDSGLLNGVPRPYAAVRGASTRTGTAAPLGTVAIVTLAPGDIVTWKCSYATGGVYQWVPLSGNYIWNADELQWERLKIQNQVFTTEVPTQ